MIVTIHQPEHIGWCGYYNKIMNADVFVYLNDCTFRKNYYQNRNRILTPRGLEYITVPVVSEGLTHTLIKDVMISDIQWRGKYMAKIENSYSKCWYFDSIISIVDEVIGCDWNYISNLNIAMIMKLRELLDIHTPTIESSNLHLDTVSSRRIADIVRYLGGDVYLSGPSGREYLDMSDFRGIEVVYHDYIHPTYEQYLPRFTPYASVIDLLMMHSPEESREIIYSGFNVVDYV